VKGLMRLAAVAVLALGFASVFAVDVDGNPLTVDFPNTAVIAAPATEKATDYEDAEGDGEERRVRRHTARVLVLHRTSHRWQTILRRWHRSFLADPPV
jgi:hypothetical protein